MNKGVFWSEINEAWRLLMKLALGEERQSLPAYSRMNATDLRGKSYTEKWMECYRNRIFDFRLVDGALIQFRRSGAARRIILSYAYYDCPYDIVSYRDYLQREGVEYSEAGDLFRREYEDYVMTSEMKTSITPIRYDFNCECYEEGVHPSSHVHIGEGNNLRIAAERVWKPLSFMLFIVRQCYPREWKQVIRMPVAGRCEKIVRDGLEKAPFVLQGEIDRMETILA